MKSAKKESLKKKIKAAKESPSEYKEKGLRKNFIYNARLRGPEHTQNRIFLGKDKVNSDEKLYSDDQMRKHAIKKGNKKGEKFWGETMIKNVERANKKKKGKK